MKRRRLVLIVGIMAVVVVVVVVSLTTHQGEPKYKGKSLTWWLRTYDLFADGEARTEAANAVRHLGTNALPCLLADLRHSTEEQPPLQIPMSAFPARIGANSSTW